MSKLLPDSILHALPQAQQANLLGHSFFPNLISPPFITAMHNVFLLAATMCFVAAIASRLRSKRYVNNQISSPQSAPVEVVVARASFF